MVKGIVRKLDPLGRITLPMELRRTFDIKECDPVEIYVDNEAICIKPVREAACVFCGSTDKSILIEKGGKHICLSCLDDFHEEVRE